MKIAILLLFIGACRASPAIWNRRGPYGNIGALGEIVGWDYGTDENGRYVMYVEYRKEEDMIYTYIADVDPKTSKIVHILVYERKTSESLGQARQREPVLHKKYWRMPPLLKMEDPLKKEDLPKKKDLPKTKDSSKSMVY